MRGCAANSEQFVYGLGGPKGIQIKSMDPVSQDEWIKHLTRRIGKDLKREWLYAGVCKTYSLSDPAEYVVERINLYGTSVSLTEVDVARLGGDSVKYFGPHGVAMLKERESGWHVSMPSATKRHVRVYRVKDNALSYLAKMGYTNG